MNIGELLGLNTPQEVDGEIKQSQYGLYEKLVAKLLTTFGISFAFPSRLYQSIPPTLRRPQEGAIVAFAWHKHKSRFGLFWISVLGRYQLTLQCLDLPWASEMT
jgi:hypothetical protein